MNFFFVVCTNQIQVVVAYMYEYGKTNVRCVITPPSVDR